MSAYVGFRWLQLIIRQFLPVVIGIVSSSAGQLPRIETNQNHTAAGVLRDGVLTIRLEIAKGEWHPEADDGMALSVYAFGEAGHPLQNPGPLIRVPQGTEIRASIHNSLPVSIAVHGLADAGVDNAPLNLMPDAVQQISFKATTPGLYVYWGASENEDMRQRHGIDSELTGAFVVDPAGTNPNDEIFVIELISEIAGAGGRETLATINGKSWPYTQRFGYNIGEPVHWRWINATNEPHALHLHGFYFRVDSVRVAGKVETFSGDSRPRVVTQRISIGGAFDMSWSPERAGQWLFHCHMLQHMTQPVLPSLPGLSVTPARSEAHHPAAMQEAAGMGQLVLGITVPDSKNEPTREWHAKRKLRLVIKEREGLPRYALELHGDTQNAGDTTSPRLIGPPIVLTRNEPTEIEVVNRLRQPTSIHWHGMELESYYDGVAGWSGSDTQIAPPIVPGGSFVARMTPPRAGTFIYHTHWHDKTQLINGLYGPLIVLPGGEKFDPSSDLTFVFSIGEFSNLQELALINGTPQSKPLQLQIGKKYRFRFINISTNNQAMQTGLRNSSGPVEWRIIAKDGIDLPTESIWRTKEPFTITVGETYDTEFSTDTAQDLLLELLLPGLKMRTSQTLVFATQTNAEQHK
jgi:FtsP/CotA-like multicopper oxidase with cupredoxin domain